MSLDRIMGVFLFLTYHYFSTLLKGEQVQIQGGWVEASPYRGGWKHPPPRPSPPEIISARVHFLFPAAKYDAEKEAKEIKESKDKQLEKIEEARRKAAEDKGQYNKVNNIIIPTLSCTFMRDSYALCWMLITLAYIEDFMCVCVCVVNASYKVMYYISITCMRTCIDVSQSHYAQSFSLKAHIGL